MSTRTRLLAASATAGALTLALTSIASATPIDLADTSYGIDIGPTQWTLSVYGALELDEANIYDGAAGAPDTPIVNSDAFDGAWAMWIDGGGTDGKTYYGASGDIMGGAVVDDLTAQAPPPAQQFIVDVTTTTEGDVVVQGPVEQHSGLDVTVQYRFYADGDLVRVLATYTNPTGAPITVTTGTESNFGSDSGTHLDAESSGDGAVDTSDRWMVTHQDDNANDPVITSVWAGPGTGVTPSQVELAGDDLDTAASITVAPGASVTLAYFSLLNAWTSGAAPSEPPVDDLSAPEAVAAAFTVAPGVAAAVSAAVANANASTSEFSSFSGRLAAGIPAGTRVLNWGTVGGATPSTPATPATPVVGAPRFTG